MLNQKRIADAREAYMNATPYPHVVIGDFFPPDVAMRLANEFPPLEQMSKLFKEPMSYKGQTSDVQTKAPAFAPIFADLQSAEFLSEVSQITGIERLMCDDILAGGGLHQSPNSGFLDIHVDANFHPFDKSMHRRVNLLVYLNKDWDDAWGGQFEIWSDKNNKPDRLEKSISPVFNRAVLFGTTRTSWHGVAPISCPEGRARKSLALYYYTAERPTAEIYRDSSVIWHNRRVWWKRAVYPTMNFAIARLKPYAKYLRRRGTFDAASK
jgi:hypothetical protein